MMSLPFLGLLFILHTVPSFIFHYFYWSIVALQCCISFYYTAKSISCKYTYIHPFKLNCSLNNGNVGQRLSFLIAISFMLIILIPENAKSFLKQIIILRLFLSVFDSQFKAGGQGRRSQRIEVIFPK